MPKLPLTEKWIVRELGISPSFMFLTAFLAIIGINAKFGLGFWFFCLACWVTSICLPLLVGELKGTWIDSLYYTLGMLGLTLAFYSNYLSDQEMLDLSLIRVNTIRVEQLQKLKDDFEFEDTSKTLNAIKNAALEKLLRAKEIAMEEFTQCRSMTMEKDENCWKVSNVESLYNTLSLKLQRDSAITIADQQRLADLQKSDTLTFHGLNFPMSVVLGIFSGNGSDRAKSEFVTIIEKNISEIEQHSAFLRERDARTNGNNHLLLDIWLRSFWPYILAMALAIKLASKPFHARR